MARKLSLLHGLSAVVLMLVVVAGPGCASGRGKSKPAETGVSSTTPTNVAPSSIASDASRLSGFSSNGTTPNASYVSSPGPYSSASADDSGGTETRRSGYSSGGGSGSCSTGGCGRCGR